MGLFFWRKPKTVAEASPTEKKPTIADLQKRIDALERQAAFVWGTYLTLDPSSPSDVVVDGNRDDGVTRLAIVSRRLKSKIDELSSLEEKKAEAQRLSAIHLQELNQKKAKAEENQQFWAAERERMAAEHIQKLHDVSAKWGEATAAHNDALELKSKYESLIDENERLQESLQRERDLFKSNVAHLTRSSNWSFDPEELSVLDDAVEDENK